MSVAEQKNLEHSIMLAPEPQALGIVIALFCGMRLGEVLALRWEDIDFETNRLFVRHTFGRKKRPDKPLRDAVVIDTGCADDSKTVIIMGKVKTHSGNRTIYLPNIARESLLKLKFVLDTYRNILGQDFNPYGFVLFNQKGYPLDANHMVDIFHRCLKHGNIKKINFHALRHTFATRALEQGCDPSTLAKVMGHAQASTSLNMYGHSTAETQKELMQKFNAL